MRIFKNKTFYSPLLGEGLGVRPLEIVCLALGLAVSAVIIGEVYYEQTFDQWFDGWERTYIVTEQYAMGDGVEGEIDQTPGAIAPAVKRYSPQVEAATRLTSFLGAGSAKVDGHKINFEGCYVADTCFFDVFPQRVIAGNPKEILGRVCQCMVSRSLAEKMGGNVVGKRIEPEDVSGLKFVVRGVFEDFPWGSSFRHYDLLVAMPTMTACTGFDGPNNYVGNDRYTSFVRLTEGHDISELRANVVKMCQENLPLADMKKAGARLDFGFQLLSDHYTHAPYIRMMAWVLSLVAFVLLFTTVMNYLLIAVGNVVNRSKEMAVRRCYGAEAKDIHAIVISETIVHVLLAVVLASILVYACKGTIEEVISAPLSALFSGNCGWILGGICLLIILVGGVVPGVLYSRIPVTTAFRGFNGNRHRWKIGLLALQFVVSGLLFAMLYVVGGQYSTMVNRNPGYEYNNLAVLTISGDGSVDKVLGELRRMPEVAAVSSAYTIPLSTFGVSGNNVALPGADRELFNSHDLYGVSDGYFELMGIPVTQGKAFDNRSDSTLQVMVSEAFAKKLCTATGWKDGCVGKRIWVSEHCDGDNPYVTICGVFGDIKIGDYSVADEERNARPTMVFHESGVAPYILVRFHELTAEGMDAVRQRVARLFPDREVEVRSYPALYAAQYSPQRNFRNAVMVGGLLTLVIALFGLVGYTADEVNRRRKEIAIRKVNGARAADVMRLLMGGLLRLALPSIIIGEVCAWFIARLWQQSFTVKFPLSPLAFALIALLLLIVIAAAMALNCYKVANSNPVKYLKDE